MTTERHDRFVASRKPRLAKTEFSRDIDHILYSSAFRRLNGVTQVVAASETALFHNRLTHSLKVGQVGRRIANKLLEDAADNRRARLAIDKYGGLDTRVVYAASLAHDLGHPPFGHVAEVALQQLLSRSPDRVNLRGSTEQAAANLHPSIGTGDYHLSDSFEGNAQSFRIVTRLAFREAAQGGISPALNLTRATLAAILKYPWPHNGVAGVNVRVKKKWGAYDSEKEILEWARSGIEARSTKVYGRDTVEYRSVEAQIMDWADDITYAIHDVEDFFRAGLIPLDLLAGSDTHFDRFLDYAWSIVSATLEGTRTADGERVSKDNVRNWLQPTRLNGFPSRPYSGSRSDREKLHQFASALIQRATYSVQVNDDGTIVPDAEIVSIVETLKQLTWYYVIKRPSLAAAQRGQTHLIRELFRDLTSWSKQEYEYIPPQDRGSADFGDRERRQVLPPRLVDYLDISFDESTHDANYDFDNKISRAVVDYITSLTETQAIELNARLSGSSGKSILEGWYQI